MSTVFGNLIVKFMKRVRSKDEDYAKLEVAYAFDPNRFIGYKLIGIDSNGKEIEIAEVNEVEIATLDEVVCD